MYKFLSYPLSVIFYFFFGSLLITFHCIQWLSFYFFGYTAHKKSVDLLNFLIIKSLSILRTEIIFENKNQLPKNNSIIFVANHQSTYDIPPLIWYLRDYHTKFISKKELGKGIPSISFNLRNGGSVLINRKKPKEAIESIKAFAKEISKKKYSVVIFPEGTRSKKGEMKKFHASGLKTLMKSLPKAIIVPVSINNSWKLAKNNYFPIPIGTKIIFKLHNSIENDSNQLDSNIIKIESTIKKAINN